MSRSAPSAGFDIAPRPARAARRITSATQVFEALKAEIVAVHLVPGTPLQDRMLIARFGVSRTPVREALIRLAEIGLVDVRPQAGTFVSRVPVNAIPEAVLVRKALEGVTVEGAALAARSGTLLPIERTIRRQAAAAAADDLDAFHEADEAFHAAIAELAGHSGIWALLAQVKVQIDRARRLTLPVLGRMAQVITEHQSILARIAANDPAGARDAMMLHLGAVIPDVDALKGRYPTYFV